MSNVHKEPVVKRLHGLIVGKNGKTIKKIIAESGGASITLGRGSSAEVGGDPCEEDDLVTIRGTKDQIAAAVAAVRELVAGAGTKEATATRTAPPAGRQSVDLAVPRAMHGLLIGKGGVTVKQIQKNSGASVSFGGADKEQDVVTVAGTPQQVQDATEAVNDVLKSVTQSGPAGDVQVVIRVNPKDIKSVIGKNGSYVKWIQDAHHVSVSTPKRDSGDNSFRIKGPPRGVACACYVIDFMCRHKRWYECPLPQGSGGYEITYKEEYPFFTKTFYYMGKSRVIEFSDPFKLPHPSASKIN